MTYPEKDPCADGKPVGLNRPQWPYQTGFHTEIENDVKVHCHCLLLLDLDLLRALGAEKQLHAHFNLMTAAGSHTTLTLKIWWMKIACGFAWLQRDSAPPRCLVLALSYHKGPFFAGKLIKEAVAVPPSASAYFAKPASQPGRRTR